MASGCDKFVTLVSGFACLSIFIYVANLDSKQDVPHKNITQENSTQLLLQQMCNFTNPLLEIAKKFDQVLEDKDFFEKVAHRLTHRQEAIHAAISLTVVVLFIFV